jgi:uncharacterized membrane protein YphA (DoxX/SURF4 family)
MAELDFVLRLALGVVFLTSAIGKLRSGPRFATTVERVASIFVAYPSRPVVVAGAVTTVAIELFLAAAFLGGLATVAAGAVAIALLVLFAIVAVAAMRHDASIDCHCFGTSGEVLGARTLARALLLLATAAAYLATAAATATAWIPSGGEEWVAAATLAAGLLLLLVWLTNLDVPVRLLGERRREANEIARNTMPASATDSDASN